MFFRFQEKSILHHKSAPPWRTSATLPSKSDGFQRGKLYVFLDTQCAGGVQMVLSCRRHVPFLLKLCSRVGGSPIAPDVGQNRFQKWTKWGTLGHSKQGSRVGFIEPSLCLSRLYETHTGALFSTGSSCMNEAKVRILSKVVYLFLTILI